MSLLSSSSLFHTMKHVKIKRFLKTFIADIMPSRCCSESKSTTVENTNSEGNQKLVKVAIIGVPNVGKSTLINQIVGRNIFAVSRKVHTTRCRARAVMVENAAQVVFLDTPGLVSLEEGMKHHLEESCIVDSDKAVDEADVIGVVHDSSNKYTKDRLDSKVLRILHLYRQKHTFLVLNKIDIMKCRRDLLDLAKNLSNMYVPYEDVDAPPIQIGLKESQLKELAQWTGWPYFKDIFMISALNGDGVADVREYLIRLAKPGKWLFEKSVTTDQEEVTVIESVVFSKLLEYLPHQVPYNLKVCLEYFNTSQDGSVTAIVLIGCQSERLQTFVMGKGGKRMKKIALGVEQDLRQFYLNDVRVKLILVDEAKLKNNFEDTSISPLEQSSTTRL